MTLIKNYKKKLIFFIAEGFTDNVIEALCFDSKYEENIFLHINIFCAFSTFHSV